jgi:hypothetical protein
MDIGSLTMSQPIQFVVIYGNPADGFNYVGPFESRDDAALYAAEDTPADWWIVMLDAPAAPDVYEGHQREYNPDNYRGI